MTSYNGINIIPLPCSAYPRVAAPSSIQWDPQEAVATTVSQFAGNVKTYDWGASWWEGLVSFAQMGRASADYWQAFIHACRGSSNAFYFRDPKASLPRGSALGAPVVSGANQTGYSLVTNGWRAGKSALLQPGDYIQIGVHLYKVLAPVESDSSGAATLSVWPNLRPDAQTDGASIITKNAAGLFRLKNSTGNKYSVNVGLYGLSGFSIVEVI